MHNLPSRWIPILVLLCLALGTAACNVAASDQSDQSDLGDDTGPSDVSVLDETCPQAVTTISLPADEAPHDSIMEWWYYTGHLADDDGNRWGFEQSFFQVKMGPLVGYAGHVAVTDLQHGTHIWDQILVIPDTGRFPSYDMVLGDWSMRGDADGDHLSVAFADYGFVLDLVAAKPAAIHNSNGIIDMGGGRTSFYYSKTHLDVSGTLTALGTARPVTGTGWMDHQWGDFDVFKSDGWDWFSIRLEDDTELMLFFLHFKDDDGGQTSLTGATYVDAEGCARPVEDAVVTGSGSWVSPWTGGDYPNNWTVRIPSLGLELAVTTPVADQEMDTRDTTLNVYWEGTVDVIGTRNGAPIAGQGYIELAGYGPWGD